MATYWQLTATVDTDTYTLRVALAELADADAVRPAAVFWRPDRVNGDGLPVAGVVGDGSAGDGAGGDE